MGDDRFARHLQEPRDAPDDGLVQRPAAAPRWRGEGQASPLAPDAHQADAALLHHLAARARLAAGSQPGMACLLYTSDAADE